MNLKNRDTDSRLLKKRDQDSQLPPSQQSNKDNQSKKQEPIQWSDNQPPIPNNPPQANYPPPPPRFNNPPPNYNQYTYPTQGNSNGLAVSGFVIALISLLLFWVAFLNFVLSVTGLILSIAGIKKSKKPATSGKGLAITGIIISTISTILSILVIVLSFLLISTALSNARDSDREVEAANIFIAFRGWIEENKKLPTKTEEIDKILEEVDLDQYSDSRVDSLQKAELGGNGVYFTPNDSDGPKLPTNNEKAPNPSQIHIITGVKCIENITQLKSSFSDDTAYSNDGDKVVQRTEQLTFAIIWASENKNSVSCYDNSAD